MPCNSGSVPAGAASSEWERCHKSGWDARIWGKPSRDEPPTNPEAGDRYTHSGSCRRPAPARKSQLRMQGPPCALTAPCQIYAGFASIIRCLAGWDPGTKGSVRKDDGRGSQRTTHGAVGLGGDGFRLYRSGEACLWPSSRFWAVWSDKKTLGSAQNLENKGPKFFLPSRSMVLKVVTAKILKGLELRRCPTACGSRFGRAGRSWSRPGGCLDGKLLKSLDYLPDNQCVYILSEVNAGGQAEKRGGCGPRSKSGIPDARFEVQLRFMPTALEPLTSSRLSLTYLRFRHSMFCT